MSEFSSEPKLGKDEVAAVKEQEISAQQKALSEAEQRGSSLAEECAALKGRLEGHSEQILSLQAHNNTLQVALSFVHRLSDMNSLDRVLNRGRRPMNLLPRMLKLLARISS